MELRLGTFNRNFFPGIGSPNIFWKMIETLRMESFDETEYDETIKSKFGYRSITRRNSKTNQETILYDNKIKGNNMVVDLFRWGIRLALAWEYKCTRKDYNSVLGREPDSKLFARVKHIYKFSFPDDHSLGQFELYFTMVDNRYEIELEFVNNKLHLMKHNFLKTLTNAIFYLYSLYQENGKYLVLLDEKKLVIFDYNNLIQRQKQTANYYRNPYRVSFCKFNKPRSINKKDLLYIRQYALTIKLDGERKMLFFSGHNVYLISTPFYIKKVGSYSTSAYDKTICDCEYVSDSDTDQIFVFDILYLCGRNIQTQNFYERFEKLKLINFQPIQKCVLKTYLYYNSTHEFYNKIQILLSAIDQPEIKSDGIIFQPVTESYFNQNTLKWKPKSLLTIDFLITQPDKTQPHTFTLKSKKDKQRNIIFKHCPSIHIENGLLNGYPVQGKIVECAWCPLRHEFVPFRIRHDRPSPNYLEIAENIWQDIQNPITKKTIAGNTLELMRKSHNNTKRKLLAQYLTDANTIVDIGSGRGGDLIKWNFLRIAHVICIEPNITNATELRRRLHALGKNYNTTISIIHSGAENTQHIQQVTKSRDISGLVSFFSLTFFSPRSPKYFQLLDTLTALLKYKSYFIGTVLDGHRILDQLQNTPDAFLTDSFSIILVGNKQIRITLNDPTSMVKDQEEFLFFFDLFVSDLKKRQINLIDTFFLENTNLPKDSALLSSCNRAFVFQKTFSYTKCFGFFHAVFLASHHNPYMEVKNKEDYVQTFRRQTLVSRLTPSIFTSLYAGNLQKRLSYKKYIQMLQNPNQPMTHSVLQILSQILNINIYVVEYVLVLSKMFEPYHDILFDDSKQSIILAKSPGNTYKIVETGPGQTLFSPGSQILTELNYLL